MLEQEPSYVEQKERSVSSSHIPCTNGEYVTGSTVKHAINGCHCRFNKASSSPRDFARLMGPASLNLVPPAPFPQPLASDADDIPPVIVDEADLPDQDVSTPDERKVEPVDTGEANQGDKTSSVNDDGVTRDSLTLGELRRYLEGAAVTVKVLTFSRFLDRRNRDNTRSLILTRIH